MRTLWRMLARRLKWSLLTAHVRASSFSVLRRIYHARAQRANNPHSFVFLLADCWNSVKVMTETIHGSNAQVPLSVHGIPVNPRHFHVTNSSRNTPVRPRPYFRGSALYPVSRNELNQGALVCYLCPFAFIGRTALA